jgi:hypothetical protein
MALTLHQKRLKAGEFDGGGLLLGKGESDDSDGSLIGKLLCAINNFLLIFVLAKQLLLLTCRMCGPLQRELSKAEEDGVIITK